MLLVWRPFTGTSAIDGHIESGGGEELMLE